MIEILAQHSVDPSSRRMTEIFQFRYRVFIERAGWNLPSQGDLEMDGFDGPDATYIVCRDAASRIRGMTRLIPTTAPYMIETLWPHLLEHEPPADPDIWEISRFGIDPEIPASARAQVTAQIIEACIEFGFEHGVRRYLAVMPSLLARRVLGCAGWAFAPCGPTRRIGRYRACAIQMDVTLESLRSVRSRAGSVGSSLRSSPVQRAELLGSLSGN